MKRIAPIALSALALVATSCGSSGLSDAAFTSKANAICSAANAANAKLSGSAGISALKSEQALVSGTITKLEALQPPSNRASAFKSYLTDVKYLQSVLGQLVTAVTTHDSAKIASIEAGVTGVETKGKAAAKAAGISACD